MIFFPERQFIALPEDFGLTAQEVILPIAQSKQLYGWYFPARQFENDLAHKRILIFFHGNAGNISYRLPKVGGWIARGVSVLLADYRGFGKSTGEIRKGGDLFEDAQRVIQWAKEEMKVPSDKIILYGESIGSAPAVEFSCREKFLACVLEAPFSSLYELARIHYFWVPPAILSDFSYDNRSRVPSLKTAFFLIHGEEDEICPVAMGKSLFEKAPSPKDAYWVLKGHHNDLPDCAGEDFYNKPYEFISRMTTRG